MQDQESQYCQDYLLYISGECTAEERALFDDHLLTCPSCQENVKDLQLVWQSLPWQMDLIDVPADLKDQVLGAILPKSSVKRPIIINKRGLSRRWAFGLAAAVAFIVVLGSLWNYNLFQQREQMKKELSQPAAIEVIYDLTAVSKTSKASGKACLLKQGRSTMLVVYLYGLDATQGKEAYQVWLLDKGQRKNAGTFLVNEKGLGVLTYDVTKESIDSIGITLEPDANGLQPRGKKVIGS